jgi:hypothetical protein
MSTILIAIILAFIITVTIFMITPGAGSEKRKHMNKIFHRLSLLGSRHKLNISGQETLNDHLLGLDGLQRKLLILTGIKSGKQNARVIDLADVKNCFLIKEYRKEYSYSNELKLEIFMERIILRFEFSGRQQPVEVPFYQYNENDISQLSELAKKAKHWETLLSKMLHMPALKIA